MAGGWREVGVGETESRSEHQQAWDAGVGVAVERKQVEREGATANQ